MWQVIPTLRLWNVEFEIFFYRFNIIAYVFHASVTLCLRPLECPSIVLKNNSSASDLSVGEREEEMSSSTEAAWHFVGLW